MTNTELMNLKAALKAKQMELAAQLRGRVRELAIEGSQPELVDWIQVMSDRDETAGVLNRLSSTLTDVKRSLRAIDDDCYGNCIGCDRPIAVKRLQSIPWAANCVRCQEQLEAGEEYAASDFYEPKAA
ncbi:MAG TPA: TraR/DksA C4-type zinc finger protein [Bryobacteraceae bacterium]|nr:TraR/DksA C4-type zinc finger protein [Bryobacteraceae bacterium]HZW94768.1 TraR/DksA C4-type zinc finger protein [Candidatus Eremiobacteraceae bacterium]